MALPCKHNPKHHPLRIINRYISMPFRRESSHRQFARPIKRR